LGRILIILSVFDAPDKRQTLMPSRNESLTISSKFENLEDVVERAESFFSGVSSDDDFVYNAVLLTSEAVTNAIEHGNSLDPSKSVYIEFISTDDTHELWVEDEGPGFAPEDVKDPLREENLLEDGGRGIFLIEHLADEVRYEKGGRRIGMVFFRTNSGG
jgi:serine/threonine-protein kinase RsbW